MPERWPNVALAQSPLLRTIEDVLEPAYPDDPVSDEVLLARLSPREAEVLDMTALGLTNGQIAERLTVTVHAVKFHLGAVYRKLGVANRTEAAFVYLRAGAAGRD